MDPVCLVEIPNIGSTLRYSPISKVYTPLGWFVIFSILQSSCGWSEATSHRIRSQIDIKGDCRHLQGHGTPWNGKFSIRASHTIPKPLIGWIPPGLYLGYPFPPRGKPNDRSSSSMASKVAFREHGEGEPPKPMETYRFGPPKQPWLFTIKTSKNLGFRGQKWNIPTKKNTFPSFLGVLGFQSFIFPGVTKVHLLSIITSVVPKPCAVEDVQQSPAFVKHCYQ